MTTVLEAWGTWKTDGEDSHSIYAAITRADAALFAEIHPELEPETIEALPADILFALYPKELALGAGYKEVEQLLSGINKYVHGWVEHKNKSLMRFIKWNSAGVGMKRILNHTELTDNYAIKSFSRKTTALLAFLSKYWDEMYELYPGSHPVIERMDTSVDAIVHMLAFKGVLQPNMRPSYLYDDHQFALSFYYEDAPIERFTEEVQATIFQGIQNYSEGLSPLKNIPFAPVETTKELIRYHSGAAAMILESAAFRK